MDGGAGCLVCCCFIVVVRQDVRLKFPTKTHTRKNTKKHVRMNEFDAGVVKAYFDMSLRGDQDARGAEACEIVLRAVADNTLQKQGRPFFGWGRYPSVLEVALLRCSASFVQRLLHIGVPYVGVTFDDDWQSSPMHIAAVSEVDAFAKCKMLDVRDLGRRDLYTALDTYLRYLLTSMRKPHPRSRPGAHCRWMMEQPECPLNTPLVDIATTESRPWEHRQEFQQMLQDAMAVRKNWTPARAAWLGAVVVFALQ
jgi:hypothetical protein